MAKAILTIVIPGLQASLISKFVPITFLTDEINRLRDLFKTWVKTKGPLWTIKRIKLLRLTIYKFLSGEPIKVLTDEIIGLHADGIPKCFKLLIPLIRSKNRDGIRLILTILQMGKAIKFQAEPNLKPITDFPRVDLSIPVKEYIEVLPRILKRLHVSVITPTWVKGHLTTKAGPMGIALSSAFAEAKILPEGLKQDLIKFGGKDFQT